MIINGLGDRYNNDMDNDYAPDGDDDNVDGRYDTDERIDADSSADFAGFGKVNLKKAGRFLKKTVKQQSRLIQNTMIPALPKSGFALPANPLAIMWGGGKKQTAPQFPTSPVPFWARLPLPPATAQGVWGVGGKGYAVPAQPLLNNNFVNSLPMQMTQLSMMSGRDDDYAGYAGFGANEDYCDRTYPRGVSAQVDAWNTKCKKGATLTNPAALAPPWTIVGKNARGLPDDSVLGKLIAGAKAVLPGVSPKAPGKVPTGAPQTGGGFMALSASPYFMPVALAAVAGLGFMLMKQRRRRA